FGQVRLDVLQDDTLLPGGKAATRLGFGRASATVQASELLHEHPGERAEILVVAVGSIDDGGQLGDCVPKLRVIEEQARGGGGGFRVAGAMVGKYRGVEIKVGDPGRNSVRGAVLVTMTGGDECELMPQVLERGTRRTVEPCLAIETDAVFVGRQQVHRGPKARCDLARASEVDDFGVNAAPGRHAAARGAGGGDRGVRYVHGTSASGVALAAGPALPTRS